MSRRTIDPTVKTAVLVAALEKGAKLPEIAKQYNVSLPSIYNWLKTVKTEKLEAVASLPVETVQA